MGGGKADDGIDGRAHQRRKAEGQRDIPPGILRGFAHVDHILEAVAGVGHERNGHDQAVHSVGQHRLALIGGRVHIHQTIDHKKGQCNVHQDAHDVLNFGGKFIAKHHDQKADGQHRKGDEPIRARQRRGQHFQVLGDGNGGHRQRAGPVNQIAAHRKARAHPGHDQGVDGVLAAIELKHTGQQRKTDRLDHHQGHGQEQRQRDAPAGIGDTHAHQGKDAGADDAAHADGDEVK